MFSVNKVGVCSSCKEYDSLFKHHKVYTDAKRKSRTIYVCYGCHLKIHKKRGKRNIKCRECVHWDNDTWLCCLPIREEPTLVIPQDTCMHWEWERRKTF